MNYSGIIALIIYIIGLVAYLRYEAKHEDDEDVEEIKQTPVTKTSASPLDINDEDATVASLVAAIECRNEFKKNVKVISVRKVN